MQEVEDSTTVFGDLTEGEEQSQRPDTPDSTTLTYS